MPFLLRSFSYKSHPKEPLKTDVTTHHRCGVSKTDEKKRVEDRQDIVVSVLQASATRRDARNYLKKYAPHVPAHQRETREQKNPSLPVSSWSVVSPTRAVRESPQFVQGMWPESASDLDVPLNLALVKLRQPQVLDDSSVRGLAKSLSQLRKLGLVSVIVLDEGPEGSRATYRHHAFRLQRAFDELDSPGARTLDQVVSKKATRDAGFMPSKILVQFPHALVRTLQSEEVAIVPPIATSLDFDAAEVVEPDDVVMALAKYFCGLQFPPTGVAEIGTPTAANLGQKIGSIERVIVLDPLGAIPIMDRPGACHRFINLEQEFEPIMTSLATALEQGQGNRQPHHAHAQNLELSKGLLSLLPSTSTALISTPWTAATKPALPMTSVTTRNRLNPLIHNLLTDKPVFSSSLPIERVRPDHPNAKQGETHVATMIKRGMPLTILPDITQTPWLPPRPGSPRLKLSDICIDLPRLQHLIEDSFDRKLDLQHYLDRVNENLAGVIIAGEYEGGAILTWEKPAGLSDEEAYHTGRLVPYLDKFAVLKSRQGSGGVADIVFNAMVRTCFPNGVCWRSRKDNPVNKWYFERSLGTYKLKDTNWAMFWTTPNLPLNDPKLRDYEDVCWRVEPSWADTNKPAD